MSLMKTSLGKAVPFGAVPTEIGVNFSLFSAHAEKIELCIFDELGQKEVQRVALNHGENNCWHVHVDGLLAGTKYGYRVYGPFRPEEGLRFNECKLLIDPYARNLDRSFCWDKSVFAYDVSSSQEDLSVNQKDSAAIVPKSIVTTHKSATEIDAIQSRKPYIAWRDTVIYEAHTRGLTQLNLKIPSSQRGTIAGLAHVETIKYLKNLGITALELLPVHAFIDEEFLVRQGLSNYWGYNTLNFFTPHLGYLQSGKPEEFLEMVEKFHAAGIEIILDVVYNHTAESNQYGPSLCYRGIDNLSYYRLEASTNRYYVNDTGCGNTFQSDQPRVMQLILDSLRFWAGEMGVDGFRFDLASILGRDTNGFSGRAAFFQAVSQDPLLSHAKMIAEPWDIGPGGYQLGAYPGEWSEWNDKYRDVCRRFWRGDIGMMSEFARRIHGSSDVFEFSGRGPRASINFITSHDGFTLADTVAYRERNNLANKENNKDGHHSNFSDNYGEEGETTNVEILHVRLRQQRNMLATLFLSQGTPMLLGGDELGRSQQGNNNAYCQDNEINWIDWQDLKKRNQQLSAFTSYVISLRKKYDLFRSEAYIHLPEDLEKEHRCVHWVASSGDMMSDHDWNQSDKNVLGWILKHVNNDDKTVLLVLFNAHHDDVRFTLPDDDTVEYWHTLLDTVSSDGQVERDPIKTKATIKLASRSMQLLIAKK